MLDKNDNVKLGQLVGYSISILAIIAGLFTWSISQVSAIEQRTIAREDSLAKETIARDNALYLCLHNYIVPMKEAIARIEAKLN